MNSPSNPVIIIGAGQSGMAAATALRSRGLRPMILEASQNCAGSWPQYYDSLYLFSPARFSAMPGLAFPGDPDRYPHRDEVVAYLESYAAQLDDVEVRTGTRVTAVATEGPGFTVHTAGGERFSASGVVAASGSVGNPYRPALAGEEHFEGPITHVVDYRNPEPYAGARVVVLGAGNSAIQVAHELAKEATVTVARLREPQFVPQVVGGHDLHHWFEVTGFDHYPGAWLALMGGAAVGSRRRGVPRRIRSRRTRAKAGVHHARARRSGVVRRASRACRRDYPGHGISTGRRLPERIGGVGRSRDAAPRRRHFHHSSGASLSRARRAAHVRIEHAARGEL